MLSTKVMETGICICKHRLYKLRRHACGGTGSLLNDDSPLDSATQVSIYIYIYISTKQDKSESQGRDQTPAGFSAYTVMLKIPVPDA